MYQFVPSSLMRILTLLYYILASTAAKLSTLCLNIPKKYQQNGKKEDPASSSGWNLAGDTD
jgi:hypothetical protein